MTLLHRVFALVVSFAAPAAFALNIASVTSLVPDSGGTISRYGKVEVVVEFSGVAATKFYEPDPALDGLDLHATFHAPGGAQTTVNGYYDGSSWHIRFSPTVVGNWTYSISATDSSGTATWTGGAFTCLNSTAPGFAKISGNYLQFSNGKTCYAVGHNNGWQYDVEQPPLYQMAAQGENLLSFWMATPWIVPADNLPRAAPENAVDGLSNYNQETCAYLDGVIARAEAAGVYLLPSIWAHDQLCQTGTPPGWPAQWDNNAYNTLCSAADFFTTGTVSDTPQWRLQKNYYRYLLARWGYSRAIVGWVAVVEIEGTTGFVLNSAGVSTWATKLKTYFAANDLYRAGANPSAYPLAISKSNAPTYDLGLGIRASDSYASKSNDTAVAQTLATETATMRASGKPALHTEFGGDVMAGASQPAHLHNGVWAAAAAGAAGSPLVWCDGGSFPMMTDPVVGAGMRTQMRCFGEFVGGLDYIGDPTIVPAAVTLNSNALRGWGMRVDNRAFGWIQNTQSASISGQTLGLSGLSAGKYVVAFYDVWQSGSVPIFTSDVITLKSGKSLAVELPSLARADMAFTVSPAPSTALKKRRAQSSIQPR